MSLYVQRGSPPAPPHTYQMESSVGDRLVCLSALYPDVQHSSGTLYSSNLSKERRISVGAGGGQVQAGVTCWRCPTAGRRLGSGEEGPQGAVEDSEQGAGETLW